MISSTGTPYLRDGHVGVYGSRSGVADDEAANRVIQDQRQRSTAMDTMMVLLPGVDAPEEDLRAALQQLWRTIHIDTVRNTRIAIHTHPLGQLADDVGEESSAAELRARGERLGMPTAHMYGNAGVGTLVYGNAGTYVLLPRRGEYFVAAGAVTHVTAGGARGAFIPPLLQSYYLGTRAPQIYQHGEVGHGAFPVTDAFPEIDGGTPYQARGALPATDVFPEIDGGGTPDLARGALPATDFFPEIDGGTPHLARGALAPSVGDGGANARYEHVVNMPPSPPDATTGTTDKGRKSLEKLLFTFLSGSVLALVPLSSAPDGTKLAIFIILAMLIMLILIGISTRASAEQVNRFATCAGIFAMTVLVSIQFSLGIYIAIAALVGMAFSAITLAV